MQNRFLLIFTLALTACSTTPEAIRHAPAQDPGFLAVQQMIERYTGRTVRWGGSIIKLDNRKNDSILEILARPLSRGGEPDSTDRSLGRFQIRVQGFLDPAVYKEGRDVTVIGTIEGSMTQKIGEFVYHYPVIKANTLHLWPPQVEARDYYYPYPDPFWPYPWYPYPYYTHPHYRW